MHGFQSYGTTGCTVRMRSWDLRGMPAFIYSPQHLLQSLHQLPMCRMERCVVFLGWKLMACPWEVSVGFCNASKTGASTVGTDGQRKAVSVCSWNQLKYCLISLTSLMGCCRDLAKYSPPVQSALAFVTRYKSVSLLIFLPLQQQLSWLVPSTVHLWGSWFDSPTCYSEKSVSLGTMQTNHRCHWKHNAYFGFYSEVV